MTGCVCGAALSELVCVCVCASPRSSILQRCMRWAHPLQQIMPSTMAGGSGASNGAAPLCCCFARQMAAAQLPFPAAAASRSEPGQRTTMAHSDWMGWCQQMKQCTQVSLLDNQCPEMIYRQWLDLYGAGAAAAVPSLNVALQELPVILPAGRLVVADREHGGCIRVRDCELPAIVTHIARIDVQHMTFAEATEVRRLCIVCGRIGATGLTTVMVVLAKGGRFQMNASTRAGTRAQDAFASHLRTRALARLSQRRTRGSGA